VGNERLHKLPDRLGAENALARARLLVPILHEVRNQDLCQAPVTGEQAGEVRLDGVSDNLDGVNATGEHERRNGPAACSSECTPVVEPRKMTRQGRSGPL